jgi:histidyl-tRNA synthetase
MTKNISGFPELLPQEQIMFNKMIQIIRHQFELHGFTPLETPAVERTSTLLCKGNDHEIYGIYRLGDETNSTKKELALRFDLTVPLARYVAQHYADLTFPYQGYHIAPVWRGERPQAGRYRQFYQCDIDIIGDGDLSDWADAQGIGVIAACFNALGLRWVMMINNRLILTGLLRSFGMNDQDLSPVMRTIDKASKISKQTLQEQLTAHGIPHHGVEVLLNLIDASYPNDQWISILRNSCDHDEFLHGLFQLEQLMKHLKMIGIKEDFIQITPSLARGLDYYTSTVCETKLLDCPEIGSICGGGRYENLAGAFTKKKLPGFGLSIGVSRIFRHWMNQQQFLDNLKQTPSIVLVSVQNLNLIDYYLTIAQKLRAQNINTELYIGNQSLGGQMKYAHKKGFAFVIIADENERDQDQVILRNMTDANQQILSLSNVVHDIEKQIKNIPI